MTDSDFERQLDRLEISDSYITDPYTNRVWPRVSGGAGDGEVDDSSDFDDGDDDEGDGDAIAAAEAKVRRSGERQGRKKLLRELGYGNAGELKEALARFAGDSGESEDSGVVEESGAGIVNPPTPTPVAAPVPDNSVAEAKLTATVAVELAAAGIDPGKVKRASQVLLSDLDPGDNPSEDDVADLIDTLRDEEPGWFAISSKDDQDDQPARGVPDPGRAGARKTPDPSLRGNQIYQERQKGNKGFELPIST